MKLLGATASHVGNLRDTNQDRAFFRGCTAALADGMGGHQGGERAAELAIDEFDNSKEHLSEDDLVQLVVDANRHVHGHAVDNGLPGMGTTLVALTLHGDDTITIANVGDSRAYWLRGEYMSQITQDHSFVEDLVRQGKLTSEEAAVHPQRNILTRAVGIGAEIEVDRFTVEEPMIGDRFLLCSDGLFNEVSEEDIRLILVDTEGCHVTAAALIDAALDTPCRDNVTVTVVDVVGNDHPLVADLDDPLEADVDTVDTLETVDPDRTRTAQVPMVPTPATGVGDGAVASHQATALAAADTTEVYETPPAVKVSPPEQQPVVTDTLVLDQRALDPDQVPSILEDERHEEEYLDFDPVYPEETAEHEVIESPGQVRTRGPIAAVLVGGLVAVALLAGGYVAARWYAQTGYFIDDEDEQLVIFQGRRGGFLWFEPVDVGRFDVPLDELSAAEVAAIEQSSFDSRQEAEGLVETLRQSATDGETANEADSVGSGEGRQVNRDAPSATTSDGADATGAVDGIVSNEEADDVGTRGSTEATEG